jgi:hypothetical protein
MQRQPINWSGGVNLFADPTQIKDNQIRLAKNMVPADGGLILGSRPAMKAVSELVFGNTITSVIPVRAQRSPYGGIDWVYYDVVAGILRFGSTNGPTADLVRPGVRNLPISLVTFNGIP